jgi:hypothetical protein
VSDPISDSDAFEGDSGQADSSSGLFDAPTSLPGFSVNQGVPGTTVRPGDDPVVGAQLAPDLFSTAFDPSQYSALGSANAALPSDLMNDARTAIGSAPGSQAGPAPLGSQDQDPQQAEAGQLAETTGFGGYLSAVVPGADSSLISALQGAASSAGGVTALFALTVSMSGGGVSAGGEVQGQHNSLGPYTIYGGPQWFGTTVNQWQQEHPQTPSSAPASGDRSDQPDVGDAVGASQVNHATDQALGSWGAGDAPPGYDSGDALDKDYETPQQEATGTGFNDSVWSDIPGASTLGQDEAAGTAGEEWSEPLGGITTQAQDDASGVNTVSNEFGHLGADPVSNTAEAPGARGVWDDRDSWNFF